jgi:hypothetical protein
LYDTITSRQDIEIEWLTFEDHLRDSGSIKGRLTFYDGSLLEFIEIVRLHNKKIIKLHYAYHYQNSDSILIFRYDNAPHHPSISTHPHHKHIGIEIEPSEPPNLNEILCEIEQLIYNNQ